MWHESGVASMSIRKIMPAFVVVLCALAASLAFASTPALAEKIYYPEVSFGEPGSGPGQLKEPVGVAVNDSPGLEPGAGDVYVVDKGNNRVERFSASGLYLGQFNGSGEYEVEGSVTKSGAKPPTGAFSHPEEVAVDDCVTKLGEVCSKTEDPSVGDVYVTDIGHGVIDKFSSTGEYLEQLTETEYCEQRELPPCSGSKIIKAPFRELRNVAVDPSGGLWVYGGTESEYCGGYVVQFNDVGALVRWFRTCAPVEGDHGLAVDSNHGSYVAAGPSATYIEKFTEDGVLLKEIQVGESALALSIVSPIDAELENDLLVDYGTSIVRYGRFGEPYKTRVEEFPTEEEKSSSFAGLSESYGLAVNGTGAVYASEQAAGRVQSFDYVPVPKVITEAPSEVSETGLTFHGKIDPEGEKVKECFFEYGTKAGVYKGGTAECFPKAGELGEGNEEIPVVAKVPGLGAAGVRSFRLVAVSETGVVRRGIGLTVSRPQITGAGITNVGSSTATATASIDPGGLETCYTLMSCSYERPGEHCIAAGQEPVPVSVELTGLTSGAECHFRIVASNVLGVESSIEAAFTTFAPTSSELPDGRVSELVSEPPEGEAGEVYVPPGMVGVGLNVFNVHGFEGEAPFAADPSGEVVAYVGYPPPSGGNSREGVGFGNEFMARRAPGGGWSRADLEPPSYAGGYVALSTDLSVGVSGGNEALARAADAPEGYSNLFQRSLGWNPVGNKSFEAVLGSFEPSLTVAPEGRTPATFGHVVGDVLTSHLEFGGGNAGSNGVPAYSHLLFEASARLPSAPEAPAVTTLEDNLYDSGDGRLYLVNVLPGGRAQGNAAFGRQGQRSAPETSNVISADGSRIFWSAVEQSSPGVPPRPLALYMRENDTLPEGEGGECEPQRACTVRVDLPEGGVQQVGVCKTKPKECEHPEFWTANRDGSRVFFTDQQRLASDATAEVGRPDLYEYDLEAPEGEQLTDLSVPTPSVTGGCPLGAPGDGCGQGEAQGVVGTSEDGSYVYFAADGVLSEGVNVEGKKPNEGEPNLYVRHDGETTFIATLAVGDGDFTEGFFGEHDGDWQADPGNRTAKVTPDGQGLVFMSRRSLTGYNNVVENTSLAEVYVYNVVTGRLSCASCNPSGEAPTNEIYPEFAATMRQEQGHGAPKVWGSFLPVSDSLTGQQPRVISEDGGRVFFDSVEPLVPSDTNGFVDVYEWEAPGVGSCTAGLASRVTGGCTFLLSGGQNPENSYLVDASATGDDVFFASRAQLVNGVPEGYEELYDSRVGGVVPSEEVRCSGTACQGTPPAPPSFATPPSVIFAGVGDFSSPLVTVGKSKPTSKCKRGFIREKIKKKETCVRKKSRKSKANRASKAGPKRRAIR
jgi:hypothetical protein